MDEMLEAKKRLYHLILQKGDQATDSEVTIAFVIMQDPEIQQLFETVLLDEKRRKNESHINIS